MASSVSHIPPKKKGVGAEFQMEDATDDCEAEQQDMHNELLAIWSEKLFCMTKSIKRCHNNNFILGLLLVFFAEIPLQIKE